MIKVNVFYSLDSTPNHSRSRDSNIIILRHHVADRIGKSCFFKGNSCKNSINQSNFDL